MKPSKQFQLFLKYMRKPIATSLRERWVKKYEWAKVNSKEERVVQIE